MTTKGKLQMQIDKLENEQEEILNEARTNVMTIEHFIYLGKQAKKNQELLSFARMVIRNT